MDEIEQLLLKLVEEIAYDSFTAGYEASRNKALLKVSRRIFLEKVSSNINSELNIIRITEDKEMVGRIASVILGRVES